jgi:hypothetical protein
VNALIECPRCQGTWWFARVFNQLVAGGEKNPEWGSWGSIQPPEIAEAIIAGQPTPLGALALVTGESRVLYVCGGCSWPGIEPKEQREPIESAPYVIVTTGRER